MVDRAAAERALTDFLRAIGHDPATTPALQGTAARVTAAYIDELCDGYQSDPAEVVEAHLVAGSTALVVLRDVAVTTMCPHHLMPASGFGVIAFAPDASLVGLGALAEVLRTCAHRLVLQEDIGEGVVAALMSELRPRWAACRLVLRHGCVSARGERQHTSVAETVAFAGEPSSRTEAPAVTGAGR